MSVCCESCNRRKPNYRLTSDLWLKRVSLILAYLHTILVFVLAFRFFMFFKSLQTSLLGKMGELAREGSVAVAVAVRDRCQVTCAMWHMMHDTWFFLAFSVCFCLFYYWFYFLHISRDSVPFGYIGPLGTFWIYLTFRYL